MKIKYCPNCRKSGRDMWIVSVCGTKKYYIECPSCHWCGKTRFGINWAKLSWNLEKR